MARRSDFAQKLLDDLRLRKERLAAAQSMRNSHSRGDGYANPRKLARSSTGGKGSGKCLPMQNRAAGRQKLMECSNQIVPFAGGRGTIHEGDFSWALAFDFDNGGKLRMVDASRNQNSMLSFLREMGRGSMDVGEGRSLTVHVPALSQLHVKEISKGAEKLNQILRAWSNGLNFDQCSVEIGKELLKGAMDLKESLRMLANLQRGGSLEFSTGSQQKNRIVLLEDGEDDDASTVMTNGRNKIKRVEPPRFSFDKPERRNRGVHKPVVAVRNTGSQALIYRNESSRFSNVLPSNPVKERKSNVIAKLMGLEELPTNDTAAYDFREGRVATLKPNSPPWSIPQLIQVERENKSPLSQKISRMMLGSDSKITAPDTRATEVESARIPNSKKPEKPNLARSYPKMDDGRLKPIRTDKYQKHEQVIVRSPDRRVPRDRKNTENTETGQKLRGKGGNRVDDKSGIPLQDNSRRKRGEAKHADGSAFLLKTSESSFQEEKIDNKELFVDGNGPENRVPEEFADTARTREYEDVKTGRSPVQKGGARVARARERKEVPAPVLHKVKLGEHLETKKFQAMKEAPKKNIGSKEGMLRLPLPRSSHSHGLQKLKQQENLDASGNIKPLQADGCRTAESVSAVQEEAEHSTVSANAEKIRYQDVSDRKDPVVSPLHITVARTREPLHRVFCSLEPNLDQNTDRESPERRFLHIQTQQTLTESENRLKRVLLRSQIFIDTAETFFDLDILPPQNSPFDSHVLSKSDDSLILDCGYEITKRKGRLQELAVHPLAKMQAGFPKVTTLHDLIKQLSDCFDRLTLHGRNGNLSCEPEDYVPRMFEADIKAGDPETNCMWDFGWNRRAFAFVERDEIARNVEKMVIGGLIDEIARDLVQAA